MLVLFVHLSCLLIALGFGLMAAIRDVRHLTIPNFTAIGCALSIVPMLFILFFQPDFPAYENVLSHIAAGILAFAGTFLLFYFNLLGGGDAKLISAFSLWAGMGSLIAFLFYVTLIGGLMGAATLLLQKYRPVKKQGVSRWIDAAQAGEQKVAYGPAIFAGAVALFIQKGYVLPSSLIQIAQGGGV